MKAKALIRRSEERQNFSLDIFDGKDRFWSSVPGFKSAQVAGKAARRVTRLLHYGRWTPDRLTSVLMEGK